MAKDTLGIDFETYSDLSLPDVGTSKYARDESTEVLMAAYNLNGGSVKQWIPAEGQDMPAELAEALVDPEVEKQAWNAAFELAILLDTLKMPRIDISQWRCTMVLAFTCSLPGKLEKCGEVVDLEPHLLKAAVDGKRLMRKFSFPRKPTIRNPATRLYWHDSLAEWNEYLSYNQQDVVAEQAILRRIRQFTPPEHEWELWHLDQQINRAGVPINREMVRNAIRVYDHVMEENLREMREITGLDNPTSQPQLLAWLKSMGYPFDDLQKGHITAAKKRIEDQIERSGNDFAVIYENRDLYRILELRQEVSRTSVKKFHAFDRATDDDGFLRYTLQFAAAGRTWRWGGRTGQLQNLPRPNPEFEKSPDVHAANVEHLSAPQLSLIYGKDKLLDLLASTIRPAIQAPPGYVLLDADLSAIENIVLGWLAGCDKITSVFRENRDPYLSFGVYLFDRPYDELWKEYKAGDKKVRTISKPGTLGCGYMLGPGDEIYNEQTGEMEATGLLGYAWNMGVRAFTLDDSKKSVEVFRNTYTEVKDYWYDLDRAVRRCIKTREAVEFGCVAFDMKGPFMRIRLPSGRYLHYVRPKLMNARTPWGEMRLTPSYEGVNDKKQWTRITSHPGKWTENIDQAIARDLLANGIRLARREGLDVRLHVHDQQVVMIKEEDAEEALKVLIECMSMQPSWAHDMPLKTAGFMSKVFMKD